MSAQDSTPSVPFGPVQLLVFGFDHGRFNGEIMPEFERLKDAGTIRLVDLLFVTKRDGEVEKMQVSDLSADEAEDLGALIGALIGVGMGEEHIDDALAAGAAAGSDGHLIDDDVWYLADAIPEDTSAAVVLLEHRWAIPLRDKIAAAGGAVLADAWIHPSDLIAIGAAASALHEGAGTTG
ncbi:MAG TPA: DUF6325 family protein [Gaiellaceae bacterium]|nr:DUF6325 family protein [Gaiellaceae bacterium]